MPWEIREEDGRYCVYREGEADPITCHDSKEDAEAHLAALYANEDAKAYDVRSVGGKFYVFRAGDESPLAGFADREQAAQLLALLTGGGRDADAPNAVKVVGEGLLGGYGVVFTGPEFKDLYGEYFTPETNLWTDYYPEVPALYHHGLDTAVGKSVVGVARFKYADDVGAWYETQLNLRSKYEQLIYELAKAGALGYSSGTVSHLAEVGPDGRIASWPVVEMTTTPTPAMPYVTQVEAVRSAYKSAGIALPEALSERKQDQTEVKRKNMDILEFIRKIARFTNFYIEGDVESLVEYIEGDVESIVEQVLEEESVPAGTEVANMAEEQLNEVVGKALARLQTMHPAPAAGLTEEAVMEMVMKALAGFKAAGADADGEPGGADDTPGEAPTTPPPAGTPKLVTVKDVEAMMKKALAPIAAQFARPAPRGGPARMTAPANQHPTARPEYKTAFLRYVTRGRDGMSSADFKALNEGLDSAGGYLAPPEFVAELVRKLAAVANVRPLCRVYTVGGPELQLPKLVYPADNKYTSAVRRRYVGETPAAGDATADEPEFGLLRIPVHTIMAELPVTRDLLEDSVFDVDTFISEEFATAVANGDEEDILTGNGNGKPLGILSDADVQSDYVASGAADAITADAIIDMPYQLPSQYRNGAVWLMNSNTASAIVRLKTVDDEYYWPDLLRAGGVGIGTENRLLGFPVAISEFMPDVAEGAYPVLFGNLRLAYAVAERAPFTFERLTEVYASINRVGFLMRYRVGGQTVAPWAVRAMKISAT